MNMSGLLIFFSIFNIFQFDVTLRITHFDVIFNLKSRIQIFNIREPHPPDLDLDLSLTKTLGSISTELGLVDNKTIISSAVNIFHLKLVYFVFLLY